jgi:hypothetical protein
MTSIERLRLRAAALRVKRFDAGLLMAEHTELLKIDRALFLHAEDAKAEAISESRQINHHHRINPHE